jgi:hypothetical protein
MTIPWNVHIQRDWIGKGWYIIRDKIKLAWYPSYDQAFKVAEKMK